MKFSFALAFSAIASASAFCQPSSKGHHVGVAPSSALFMSSMPARDDWKGYYTEYDDNQVIKTGADVDFDPLGFSETNAGLFFMREAEIKHGRLAMLAAAGWPLAELFDRPLANLIGQQPVVDAMDRTPSVLNGGLDKISPIYWAGILIAASAIDLYQINKANSDPSYTPGALGFDPLGLYPKDEEGQKEMLAKELRHGRLAMIAITAFAVQEFVSKTGVVDETPVFFKFLGGFL